MNFEHVSVMLMPTVDMLDVREGGIYVDGTLGGGGHRTIAGAQLKGATIEEAKVKLKEIITDMLEKGDI